MLVLTTLKAVCESIGFASAVSESAAFPTRHRSSLKKRRGGIKGFYMHLDYVILAGTDLEIPEISITRLRSTDQRMHNKPVHLVTRRPTVSALLSAFIYVLILHHTLQVLELPHTHSP